MGSPRCAIFTNGRGVGDKKRIGFSLVLRVDARVESLFNSKLLSSTGGSVKSALKYPTTDSGYRNSKCVFLGVRKTSLVMSRGPMARKKKSLITFGFRRRVYAYGFNVWGKNNQINLGWTPLSATSTVRNFLNLNGSSGASIVGGTWSVKSRIMIT